MVKPAVHKRKRPLAIAPATVERPMGRRRGLQMRVGLGADGKHTLEIMHASDIRCDGVELPVSMADTATGPVWIQLAKVGTFRGHPAGPFELTPAIFTEICANFNATANLRIPIDFEHASEQPSAEGSIPQEGAPAQGWITQLDNRGMDGLWGLVEWLEPARSYILDRKYRYFSPAIRFGAKDRVSGRPIGARMTSGALTNSPFLDGLAPLAARDNPAGAVMSDDQIPLGDHHEFMRRMRTCMRLADLATPEEMRDHLNRLRAYTDDAEHPDAEIHGVKLGEYIHPLRALMAMPAHSTAEEIFDAVEAMIDAAIERHEAIHHVTAADSEPEETDMPPTTASDSALAIQLGEANTSLKTLSDEKATLTLRLTKAESDASAAAAVIAAKDAEIVALRDAATKRDAAALDARVDEAFDTYKDAQKLSPDHRVMMRLTAASDPVTFDKLYPRMAPNQRHLLANLSGSRTPTAATAPHQMGDKQPQTAPGGAIPMSAADHATLHRRLMSEKGMGNEEATTVAFKVARGQMASPV